MTGCAYVVVAAVIVVGIFIWWRYTSVARGARQRDERILALMQPVLQRLTKNDRVSPEEVAALAATPQNRPVLYEVLQEMQKVQLFPAALLDPKSQAEGQLAYWMMHPNELQDSPAELQLVEKVHRNLDGEAGDFYVFRYRMAAGHWAGSDWLLGVAGPYVEGAPPYMNIAGAFSRAGDKDGEVAPSALVDWFIETVRQKSSD